MTLALLADVTSSDLGVLFVLLAILCFAGAAYMAYLTNWLATALLVFVGVVVLVVP